MEIRFIMDSAVEDVLAFKTCCGLQVFDQNLEIHLRNTGDRPVTIQSALDLEGPDLRERVANLLPGGGRAIAPGETAAFYCQMDEEIWRRARRATFTDTEGRSHVAPIEHGEP